MDEQAIEYSTFYPMAVLPMMKCFNHMVCSSHISHRRDNLHWEENVFETGHNKQGNIKRDRQRNFMMHFGVIDLLSTAAHTRNTSFEELCKSWNLRMWYASSKRRC